MSAWRNQQKLDLILKSLQTQITGGRDRGWDRGNRGKGGGKGGKGDGKGAGGVRPALPSNLEPCRCCGRTNHLKRDCRFREKCCNFCGREGHLEAVCWEKLGGGGTGTPKTDHKPSPPAKADPATPKKDGTDQPWMCHKCHAVVPDQALQKCPEEACRTKRIMPEKPPEAPRPLIGKEARKIIESAAGVGENGPDADKKRAEMDSLIKTIEDAKKYGFKEIQELSEKKLAAIKLASHSPDLDVAKDTRTVMSDRVRLLHTHEAKCGALEAKCERATEDIKKHKAALEEKIKEEKERHAAYMKGITEEVAIMIKREEEVIKDATQALKVQREEFRIADENINEFIAKQLPVEQHAITPKMLTTDVITQHLLSDQRLAGIIDLQAAGVAESLCSLFNLLVESKGKLGGSDEE